MPGRKTSLAELIRDWFDVIFLAAVFSYLMFVKSSNAEILISLSMMLICAFFVEVYYIPRIGVLPNLLVVFFVFRENWGTLPDLLRVYLLVGAVIGTISFFAGVKRTVSLPSLVYKITYLLFGLKTVLAFYVPYLLFGLTLDFAFWCVFLASLITTWYMGVKRFGNKNPFS
jgi:hypothetical protein